MRTALIAYWSLALTYFLVQFMRAEKLPQDYGGASPTTFRMVYVVFMMGVIATLYYLATNRPD